MRSLTVGISPHCEETDLSKALAEWRSILGDDAVLAGPAAQDRYGADTSGLRRRIPAALQPSQEVHVRSIVMIAVKHGVPLYPISTGRNWGYGTASPCVDDCVVVDLSRLNRIVSVDEELGLVTVEPGVTQGDLRAHLDSLSLPFLIPTTGAGPNCSLLGNALERGYGITPYTDHFQAVVGVQAVLPTGELYRSPLPSEIFKWGVGPYIDGLFSQGNFGIVTRVTIALARRPEQIKTFYFRVRKDADLEAVVVAIRELLRVEGSNIGGINLISDSRLRAMSEQCPRERTRFPPTDNRGPSRSPAGLLTPSPWTGVCSIYGSRAHVAATCKNVKRLLGSHIGLSLFVDDALIAKARRLSSWLPRSLAKNLLATVTKMSGAQDLIMGIPNEAALSLAYWKSSGPMPARDLDPARDGCGLLWYSPLVPMKPDSVRQYVDMVRRECAKYGLEAPITLTTLNERVFDSTLPILFDRQDSAEGACAENCYRALFNAGRRMDLLPYRLGSQFMPLLVDTNNAYWKVNSLIKKAIDPSGILAPGRYSRLGYEPITGEAP